MMGHINIRKVNNGYLVYNQSDERHAPTTGEFVFNDFKDLCEHLEKWDKPLKEVKD